MKKGILYLGLLAFVFLASGCVVRTYSLTRDRVDQDISSGNRGYLQGKSAAEPQATERKTTRTTEVVEIELHSPVKFEKMPKPKAVERTEDREVWGNRGYVTGTAPAVTEVEALSSAPDMQKYTVAKNDTLQKISQKFYGTTKKWQKIYDANRDQLKGPNKIYPGQTLMIPQEALKEPKENLK